MFHFIFSKKKMFFNLIFISISINFVEIENETHFNKYVGGKENLLLMYYKNGCAGCETLLPLLNKTAQMFPGTAVLSLNCMNYDNMMLCYNNQIDRYPTVHFYKAKSRKPIPFNDYKCLDFLADFVATNLNQTLDVPENQKEFNRITNEDFDNLIANETHFFITYYKPWCRYCHNLLPRIKLLKNIFRRDKNVKIYVMNCETYPEVCKKHASYYPELKIHKGASYEFEYKNRTDLDYLVELINNEFNTQRTVDGVLNDSVGLLPQAEQLVEKFFENSDKEDIIKQVEAIDDERKNLYIQFMKKIKEEGNGFIAKEIKEQKEILTHEADDSVDFDTAKIALNVLSVFDRKLDKIQRMNEL